ncbi:hypothetical protein L9F63_008036, partial [Diploptera punctata]
WTISEIKSNFTWSKNGYGNGTLTNNGLGGSSWEITVNLDAKSFGIFEVVVITQHEVSEDEGDEYEYKLDFAFDEMVVRTSGPGIVKSKLSKKIHK